LEVVEAAPELDGMQRSLRNAYGLYLKTRPAASSESVRRAKALQAEGPHPLLLAQIPEGKYSSLQVRWEGWGDSRCRECLLPVAAWVETHVQTPILPSSNAGSSVASE
jgi:hypothetical protein